MSVLVKDWNLPDMCLVCPFFSGQGCKVMMRLFPDWVNVATRPTDCPLSEYHESPTYIVDDPNKKYEIEYDAEYINNDIKAIGIGDNVGIDIPKPIASINFDAYHAGTYTVYVKQDGSYLATFVGTMHENK